MQSLCPTVSRDVLRDDLLPILLIFIQPTKIWHSTLLSVLLSVVGFIM
jgi:hypothetical protein